MKPLLALTLTLPLLLAACSRTEPPAIVAISESSEEKVPAIENTIRHVDAAGAAALLAADDSVVVLDVRTPEEFAEGHIAGAVNVDFKAPTFKEEAAALDTSKTYLVHCRSGARSTASLDVLQALGFEKIHHLDSGMSGWIDAGNAVEE